MYKNTVQFLLLTINCRYLINTFMYFDNGMYKYLEYKLLEMDVFRKLALGFVKIFRASYYQNLIQLLRKGMSFSIM